VISDVTPKGPAEAAGLQVQDIVLAVDGRPILGLPGLTALLYLHPPDEAVRMEILRGSERLSLLVPAIEAHDQEDKLIDFIDPNNRIARLGIFAMDFDERLRTAMPDVRIPSGVVVLGRSLDLNALTADLRAGDIIHAFNRTGVDSVQQLRSLVRQLKTGDPAVLQIERQQKLQYVTFETE
jgi:serine protease Do